MSSRRQAHAFAEGVIDHQHKRSTGTLTIAGALTITDDYVDCLSIDGGASDRDVTLPAPARANEGRAWEIWNIGSTNNLVIKNSGGSTLFTLTPGHVAFVRNIAGVTRAAGTVTNT